MLVKEELERADAEELARYRRLRGVWAVLFATFTGLSVLLGINQLFNLQLFIGYVFIEPRYYYTLMALLLPLVFLIFPPTKSSSKDVLPWYDILLALLTFVILLYFIWFAERILDEAWEYSAPLHGKLMTLVEAAVVGLTFLVVLVLSRELGKRDLESIKAVRRKRASGEGDAS